MSTTSTTPPRLRDSLAWLVWATPPLLWAGNFIVGRAVRDVMTPMTLSLGRWTIALLCLLPFALAPMRRDWRHYWAHRWQVLGISTLGVAAFNSLVYLGLRTTTAHTALLLNSLPPLLIVLAGSYRGRQRLGLNQGLGLALSLAGVVTLVLQGRWSAWHTVHFAAGDWLVLGAMVCWTFYTLWLRALPASLDRLGLMGVQIAVALPLLLPFYLSEQPCAAPQAWPLEAWAALAYVGIFPSVLAYLLYMRSVQHFGAVHAGLSIHLIPVFGVMLSTLVLGERLHGYHAAGMAAIAAGIACTTLRSGQHRMV